MSEQPSISLLELETPTIAKRVVEILRAISDRSDWLREEPYGHQLAVRLSAERGLKIIWTGTTFSVESGIFDASGDLYTRGWYFPSENIELELEAAEQKMRRAIHRTSRIDPEYFLALATRSPSATKISTSSL